MSAARFQPDHVSSTLTTAPPRHDVGRLDNAPKYSVTLARAYATAPPQLIREKRAPPTTKTMVGTAQGPSTHNISVGDLDRGPPRAE